MYTICYKFSIYRYRKSNPAAFNPICLIETFVSVHRVCFSGIYVIHLTSQ